MNNIRRMTARTAGRYTGFGATNVALKAMLIGVKSEGDKATRACCVPAAIRTERRRGGAPAVVKNKRLVAG